MTLILNNEDVQSVLTMDITMAALEQAYAELTRSEAVCRPRIDIQIRRKMPRNSINGEPWRADRCPAISRSG